MQSLCVDGHAWEISVWRERKHGTRLAVPKRVRGDKDDGAMVEAELAFPGARDRHRKAHRHLDRLVVKLPLERS